MPAARVAPARVAPARPKPDRGAAAVELALARQDLVAGALGARKASSSSVHRAALKRLAEVRSDVVSLARVARPAKLTAPQRRSYETYYGSLVANAGFRLDDAYERGTEARDLMEASLARGTSLLRRIGRERRADDDLLRTIGG